MPLFRSYVLDYGLNSLAEGDFIYICTAEPTTYTEAISTYAIGNRSFSGTGVFGAPTFDLVHGGRKVISSPFTDGICTTNGTALFWAVVDTSQFRLLVSGSMTSYQLVAIGEAFSLPAFSVGMLAQ